MRLGSALGYYASLACFSQNQHDEGRTDMRVDDAGDQGRILPEQFAGHIADL
jgi:hypothetical protein